MFHLINDNYAKMVQKIKDIILLSHPDQSKPFQSLLEVSKKNRL